MRGNKTRQRLVVLVALFGVLATTATANAQEDPTESAPFGTSDDAVVEIVPSTSAIPQANEIYGWEPLGIVAGGTQMRRHSLGADRLEVWICNVGGPYNLTPNQVANKLDNELGPYFAAVSQGRYQPNFAAGGTLDGGTSSDCLGGINQTSNANGVIVVENGYVGSALGGPGLLCNGGGSCPEAPDTFPANSRYMLAGAETVNDGAAQDAGFTSALVSVIAHEVGHSLHFPHSYSGQTFVGGQLWEYDNPTDNMSGNLTSANGSPSETLAEPYQSMGFNRYAAGWVDSDQVLLYRGGPRSVKLSKAGGDGRQLIVLPQGAQGFYVVLETRLPSTYDPVPGPARGVQAHTVDQRTSVCADDPRADALAACFSLFREHKQRPPSPYGADHTLKVGDVRTYGAFQVTVTGQGSGFMRVELLGFSDIIGNTFTKEILWLAEEEITLGCNPPANDQFCPEDDVTRAQMASFLARALDLPKASQDYFNDDEGNTHEGNINRLAAAGITQGCATSNTYCPDDNVSRAQMASFLARALDLPKASQDYFNDDEGNTHESNINRLAKSGITQGCNSANTQFCPDDPVTRGQMAAFLYRGLSSS
jgi:S-layer homology domain